MAEYIAKLDMTAFVYDYDYNAPSVKHLRATHEPFFKLIREKQPNLPIIMASRPCEFRAGKEETAERFAIIKKTYDNAIAQGDGMYREKIRARPLGFDVRQDIVIAAA